MDKEIQLLLDKYSEEVIQWSQEHMHKGLIFNPIGEGLPLKLDQMKE